MSDSGIKLTCYKCGDELESQYYIVMGKNFCRKCYTARILQTKQWNLIPDFCSCGGINRVSVCPHCGKIRVDHA